MPRPVTAQEAQLVWKAQRKASARSVAKALNQAGRHVHFTTVSRWQREAWRPVQNEHLLERARASLDSAIPVLTGNPTSTADAFLQQPESKQLEALSDRELVRTAAREIAIALILASRALQRQITRLISEKPKETAVLVLSLAQCFKAVVTGFVQAGLLERPISFFKKGVTDTFLKK
jgi:hypothetical protein